MPKRAVVCLSGGVDSAVAGLLLKDQGYDVHAITFWFWSFPGAPDYAGATQCCSIEASALAAREIGISHETIDASERFHRIILEDFVARYRRGETPNPCGRCNRYLRFGLALDYAQKHGFDIVATGHHVRLTRDPDGRLALRRGTDPDKDQSYVLYGLTQADLGSLMFPVGGINKDEVFAIARRRGLTAADLPESQDLCFAFSGQTTFLFEEADFVPGPILDLANREIGRHKGLPRYTIGQRRGLDIPSDRPLFVVEIDPSRNALIVGSEDALYRTHLTAVEASFIAGRPPEDGSRVEAKIRYRSPAAPATFRSIAEDEFSLTFDEPQRAIAPGQLAVVYNEDRLLGGGTIAR